MDRIKVLSPLLLAHCKLILIYSLTTSYASFSNTIFYGKTILDFNHIQGAGTSFIGSLFGHMCCDSQKKLVKFEVTSLLVHEIERDLGLILLAFFISFLA